eukprot:scaffold107029_cov18-Tisochrysis_lutea.AAC.4
MADQASRKEKGKATKGRRGSLQRRWRTENVRKGAGVTHVFSGNHNSHSTSGSHDAGSTGGTSEVHGSHGPDTFLLVVAPTPQGLAAVLDPLNRRCAKPNMFLDCLYDMRVHGCGSGAGSNASDPTAGAAL